jgi:hypothetical protein
MSKEGFLFSYRMTFRAATRLLSKRGGSGDTFEVLARPTAEQALEDARIYLTTTPERRLGAVLRPVLHLMPDGLR